MEETNSETSERCESERIKSMQAHIETIKSSEEIGVKYMQEWEEKVMERQKALEEGMEKGIQKGAECKMKELVEKKLKKGKSAAVIAEELEAEIENIQEIIKQMGNI